MRRLAAAVLALLAAAGCGPFGAVSGTSDEIAEAVRSAGLSGKPVRLASVTGFEWDRVHVFPPYTTHDTVREQLGFDWGGADDSDIDMLDWITLLVFVRDGEVVAAYDHDVTGGNFSEIRHDEDGLTPREAVLSVNRYRAGGETFYDVSLAERP